MLRTILHSDLNSFYASVECLCNPSLRDQPVAVVGDPDLRHGIILTKNQLAKRCGIVTGEAIWQARQKCPGLVVVKADYPKYLRYARLVREVYAQYTDQVEPFGLDEAWLDVTGSTLRGSGPAIADELRRRVYREVGITLSVGVADNKIFAKLGSDMKKPDATTVIDRQNYRDKVWPLPAENLLYVGQSTRRKLFAVGVLTIGDIARCDCAFLRAYLGKWGSVLWTFANGLDDTPVVPMGEEAAIKSIGNSTTTPRDLLTSEDVKITLCVLAESVASRLREHGLKCRTVQLSVRDQGLVWFERQAKLRRPSQVSSDILSLAMELFTRSYGWEKPIRSLGVRAADLVSAAGNRQISFLDDDVREERSIQLESTVDQLRRRFGHFAIQRALMLTDGPLTRLNPKEDIPTTFPVSYF